MVHIQGKKGCQTLRLYSVELPFALGSVVKYRYLHSSGPVPLAEHLIDESAARYRLYHVTGQGSVLDVISSWTDSTYKPPTGRIIGEATDAQSGQPIPNLLITAGGAQAISKADGSFVVEGLPPGVHNLVAYSMDGSYRPFQQGARVAVESTTPTPLTLEPADRVNLLFVVSVPEGTPPVSLRIAGNLFQLGNSFGNLRGDLSSVATNMPEMELLPDGRYSLTLNLPRGADIRYKYTLGDGFWNAEHDETGAFVLRQIIVPEENALIEDKVETWRDNQNRLVSFDITVPDNTPPGDFISIQFNPLIGWTEPLPMWQLGEKRWAYILYSPLNLPGNFSYRYCRNNQCGYADDAETPGVYGIGRLIELIDEPQTLTEPVLEWNHLYADPATFAIAPAEVPIRGSDYLAGIEWIPDFYPNWRTLLPDALDNMSSSGANWVVFSPTWTYGKSAPGNNPPVLAPLAGQDATWFDMIEAVNLTKERNLNAAIYPRTSTIVPVEEWWSGAERDFSWWPAWFYQYRSFILHHADLAQQTGASALILGGEDITPALPDGLLPDGTPSDVPGDAGARWSELINEVRDHFSGQILWALPAEMVKNPPEFLDAVDQVYLVWSPEEPNSEAGDPVTEFENWLDYDVMPFQIILGKPIVFGAMIPSNPSLETQLQAFEYTLRSVAQRDWISGFVARGHYPPAALQDLTASTHGKPATNLLAYWFPRLLGITE